MKHPKSYDSTPETRKRMSRVRLKRGIAETMLAKSLWHSGQQEIIKPRASLVAQWERVCWPMTETPDHPLLQEDPTCHGATKPMCHHY